MPQTPGPAQVDTKIINKFGRFTNIPSCQRKFSRCRPGARVDGGRKRTKVIGQPKDTMVALKSEMGPNEISGKPDDSGKPPKAKIRVFGEEMIEKEVKSRGNTGRIYLPPDWVGKLVKIIRID